MRARVSVVGGVDRPPLAPSFERLREAQGCTGSKGLRIVALDLPTSHQGMQDAKEDEFSGRMLETIK